MLKHELFLNVSVEADEYRRIVMDPLADKEALIVLMLDLTDLQNSMIPNLSESIGKQWSLVVVGNKADMIPQDSPTYVKRMKGYLHRLMRSSNIRHGQVKHVCVVSAKTGYGIENLVTELMSRWKRKGIYLFLHQ